MLIFPSKNILLPKTSPVLLFFQAGAVDSNALHFDDSQACLALAANTCEALQLNGKVTTCDAS